MGPTDSSGQPVAGLRPRVLLVEDGDADVVAFHRSLSNRAPEVEFQRARNGTEAVEMLRLQHELGRAGEPLVLFDLDLSEPKEDGVLEAMRGDATLRALPVVGYTAEPAPAGSDLASRLDLDGCLHTAGGADESADTLVGFLVSYLQLQV